MACHPSIVCSRGCIYNITMGDITPARDLRETCIAPLAKVTTLTLICPCHYSVVAYSAQNHPFYIHSASSSRYLTETTATPQKCAASLYILYIFNGTGRGSLCPCQIIAIRADI